MILRSVTRHVRDQNWFAVFLDFLIVIIGVFIGIQVANWNEARVAAEREALLVLELRAEVERNAAFSQSLGEGLLIGAAAARRLLRMSSSSQAPCEEECWPVVVDLMHASQWQQQFHQWTTYEELRRAGLPSDRRIIDAVETFQEAGHRAAQSLESPPVYRTLVRRLIPIDLQDAYWQACFLDEGGTEAYVHPCERPAAAPSIDAEQIARILDDRELMSALREWTSVARVVGSGFVNVQQDLAEQAIASIDASRMQP